VATLSFFLVGVVVRVSWSVAPAPLFDVDIFAPSRLINNIFEVGCLPKTEEQIENKNLVNKNVLQIRKKSIIIIIIILIINITDWLFVTMYTALIIILCFERG